MKTIVTELRTEAVYSKDGERRFLLRKSWDSNLPKIAVILLCAGSAGTVELDMTTQLVLNNASRLGFGSVVILNLFATTNDHTLKKSTGVDRENLEVIIQECAEAEKIVFAPGTGKTKNKLFAEVQEQTLRALLPYGDKLYCLVDEKGGSRGLHPLSPRVRCWTLAQCLISDFIDIPNEETMAKKKGKSKPSNKQTEE
ncbi:MAG: DUF1643 domain-containing protein [Oscillospiraceae bacterium]|nr:DUF1643 domain-containing protein [Oscillospiraceae bacterium]